jgi:hypothetical protein
MAYYLIQKQANSGRLIKVLSGPYQKLNSIPSDVISNSKKKLEKDEEIVILGETFVLGCDLVSEPIKLTFLGTLAQKIFCETYNDPSNANVLASCKILDGFDIESFNKECDYITKIRRNQLKELRSYLENKNICEAQTAFDILEETNLKAEKYEISRGIISSIRSLN